MNTYSLINSKRKVSMPNLDKTGPRGEGPKTGKRRGECDPKEPTEGSVGVGRGCRWSKGFGLGFGQNQPKKLGRSTSDKKK